MRKRTIAAVIACILGIVLLAALAFIIPGLLNGGNDPLYNLLHPGTPQKESDIEEFGGFIYSTEKDTSITTAQTESESYIQTESEYNSAKRETMSALPAGTYTFYAIGSSDLSHFVLPTKEEASPSSVITRAENQDMCDLLQKTTSVTIEDGENVTQNIVLDHKVLSIDQLEIKGVPDDVTKVEVSVSPLYKSIQLDGSYVTNATESYKIALEQDGTSNTWQATPNQVLFPSKGTPNIKVSFTTASGVKSYSYTASEELPANHHFTISGTYTPNSGIALTGILTASDWGEDRTITFGFDESNYVTPVAGTNFNDYYVISVNSTARTALLLAKKSISYTVPPMVTFIHSWLVNGSCE